MATTQHPRIVHNIIHDTNVSSIGHIGTQIKSDIQKHNEKVEREANCYILVKQFISSNPTWAIDSMVTYMLREYAPFHITPKIISECLYDYIHDKY